jgi:hypothetical protein
MRMAAMHVPIRLLHRPGEFEEFVVQQTEQAAQRGAVVHVWPEALSLWYIASHAWYGFACRLVGKEPPAAPQARPHDTKPWLTLARCVHLPILCHPQFVPQYHAAFTRAAKAHNVLIAAGSIYMRDQRGVLRNMTYAFAPEGEIACYHKRHLMPIEVQLGVQPSEGGHTGVFAWRGVTFGLQICFDLNHPDVSAEQRGLGAQVVLAGSTGRRSAAAEPFKPTADGDMPHIARARETGMWFVRAYPEGYIPLIGLFNGCSSVVAPDGHIAAIVPQEQGAQILTADIPL